MDNKESGKARVRIGPEARQYVSSADSSLPSPLLSSHRCRSAIVHRCERMIPLLQQTNQPHARQQTNAQNGGSARGRCGCCAASVFGIANTHTNSPFVFVRTLRGRTPSRSPAIALNPALSSALVASSATRRGPASVRPSRTHLACRIPDFELDDRIAQLDGLREEGGCRGKTRQRASEWRKRERVRIWTQQRMVLVRRVGSHEQAVRARVYHSPLIHALPIVDAPPMVLSWYSKNCRTGQQQRQRQRIK